MFVVVVVVIVFMSLTHTQTHTYTKIIALVTTRHTNILWQTDRNATTTKEKFNCFKCEMLVYKVEHIILFCDENTFKNETRSDCLHH